MWAPAPLTGRDFESVRRLTFEATGISLREDKSGLVSSRLDRLVHRRRFATFADYVRFLQVNRESDEFAEFVDTLTTNHSGFWREPEHFTFLSNRILANRATAVRIWSAACATGEEPYTIAMCCLEAGVTASVSASDISRTALAFAARGSYESSRVAPLPAGLRQRHFQADPERLSTLRVSRAVRSLVRFGVFNLLHPLPGASQFDAIFCRNVMIYFDPPTRDSLIARLIEQLVPGGYLLTGHSETLLRLPDGLKYVQPAVYRRV